MKLRLLVYLLPACLLFLLPGEPTSPTTILALVGDVMLGRGVAQALDGDWEAAFAGVQPWLSDADLAFANLESPLTTSPPLPPFPPSLPSSPSLPSPPSPPSLPAPPSPSSYDLRAPLEAVASLHAAGFDVVSLVNNHALDAGQAGLRETVDTLHAAGIATLANWETGTLVDGSPIYQSTSLPTYHSTNLPTYQPTNLPIYRLLAFDDSLTPLDVEATASTVANAAAQADLVIVSIHWGGEYQAAPSSRQRTIASQLARAGAGLIVGHGPHVLQRIEWVGETLVAYSLGNFLFDQPYPADCRWGAILRVTLRDDRIVAVEALPTVVERGHVIPASPETAAHIRTRLASGIRDQEPGISIQPPIPDPRSLIPNP